MGINPEFEYKAQDVSKLRLIWNENGSSHYNWVLRMLNEGRLKGINKSKGIQVPYWFVNGKDLLEFKENRMNYPDKRAEFDLKHKNRMEKAKAQNAQ